MCQSLKLQIEKEATVRFLERRLDGIITPGANAKVGVPDTPETKFGFSKCRYLLSFVRDGFRQSDNYKSSLLSLLSKRGGDTELSQAFSYYFIV
jgi:hypothetical protein